jgi:AraC-like DNA-binding protein
MILAGGLGPDDVECLTAACAGDALIEAPADAAATVDALARRRGRVDLTFVACAPYRAQSDEGGPPLIRTIAHTYPWVPIVAVVGAGCGETPVINAVRCGVTDVITSPLHPGEVHEILQRLVARHGPTLRVRATTARMAAIATLVERHCDAPLSIRALAKRAGLSPWHFSRTFRAVAGRPFRAFLNERRLLKARELLEHSDLSVTQIAHEAGFYDLPHFDRAFLRRFGLAPTAYRTQLGIDRRCRRRHVVRRPA